ncbi:hypothetical protein JB92DRAFT_3064025 [Gautieria morchelliformis]|nr:hypothetical protein JB92DRAFT_3064025 [Gautieria morchelliformis]
MLELNDIQCWVTTKDMLPPLTALCEIHTRNPYGEISKAVATCEMDAAMPWTQRRFQKLNKQIRRATSFSVTEMSTTYPSGSTQALSLGINNPSSALAYSLLQTSPGSSSAPCAPPPSSPASDSMGGYPAPPPTHTHSVLLQVTRFLEHPPMASTSRTGRYVTCHTFDDDENYSTKIAGIDMKLGSVIQKLVAIQGKEEYCEPEWAQTLDRIRSAELECGSLSPGKSFFEYWTSTYDSDEDEDFVTKRGKIEVELQELRKHLSGLGEKIYRQREAKLARLQVNIQDANVAAALNSTSDCSSKADFWLC